MNTQTTINVEKPPHMTLHAFMWEVERCLGLPAKARFDGETWVLKFDHVVNGRIAALSESLGEDCIAVLPPDGLGFLAGPRSAAWQPFDHSKFKVLT